jgi:hypothetical protein
MTKELQLRSVLNKAVRAYRLARRRGTMQKSVEGRNSAKNLAKDYPEFYTLGGPEKNLIFKTGMSADEVLEDYLQKIGEKRCSKLWYRLACVVVARGERDDIKI